MSTTDFKLIPLKDIHPDPNQPRKIYDETAMQELVESVKAKGILQPILIRPNGNGYKLVCGERRYRASTEAGLQEIPAVIRELSDDEALELQIIENLQRKDVHPMEEAVAFKSLLDHKKYAVGEIANRVGKREFYVKQRLKLNSLVQPWQQLFYKNGLSLSDALRIALLETKLQEDLFKEENPGSKYELSDWTLRKYKGNLNQAPFDLTDPLLNPKMGPCTSCPFNTSVACLFPEDATSARCMNVPCYRVKVDNNFKKQLVLAKEDPAMVFINETYSSSKDKVVESLQKEGFAVLQQYSDYSSIEPPEKPNWEEWKDDYYDDDESEEVNRKEFEKEVADYQKDLDAYNKKIASGKFKRAFVVTGEEKGKYVYVELKQKGAQKKSSAAVASSTEPTIEDIDQEIQKIKDREKRAKELDAIRVYTQVQKTLLESKVFVGNRDLRMTQEEITASAVALWEAGSHEFRKFFKKQWGISTEYYESLKRSQVAKISGLTELGLNELLFHFILEKLTTAQPASSHIDDGRKSAIYNIAKFYHGNEVSKAELEQEEIATKRASRVTKRLADLMAKKSSLQISAKQKPASKQSSKKGKA